MVGSPRNYQLYQDYVMVDLKAERRRRCRCDGEAAAAAGP